MQTCGIHSVLGAHCQPSENDRTRYTIHSDARKELLKRLLLLNHKLYAEEEAKGLHKEKPAKNAVAPQADLGELPLGLDLFGRLSGVMNDTQT
jgi:hypothetical protein